VLNLNGSVKIYSNFVNSKASYSYEALLYPKRIKVATNQATSYFFTAGFNSVKTSLTVVFPTFFAI